MCCCCCCCSPQVEIDKPVGLKLEQSTAKGGGLVVKVRGGAELVMPLLVAELLAILAFLRNRNTLLHICLQSDG
jgi:hypothetical protein